MGEQRLADVIATRELWLTSETGERRRVEVRIGRPRAGRRAGEAHVCEFQIDGFGDGDVKCTYGVDAMQALVLALVRVGMLLSASEEAKAGRLGWLGETSETFGFPLLPP